MKSQGIWIWILSGNPANICFEQKYKNSKNSTENGIFYNREKSLYIAWACFRNFQRRAKVILYSKENCKE